VIALWPLLVLAQADSAAPQLPLETFFRHPELLQAQLSPDGKHVAALTQVEDTNLVVVLNLETGKKNLLRGGDVYNFRWLNNDRLLLEAGGTNFFGAMVAVNRDNSQPRVLVNPLEFQARDQGYVDVFDFLSMIEGNPDCFLAQRYRIWAAGNDLPRKTVCRINSNTGKITIEEKNPGNVVDFYADCNGQVRGAVAQEGEKLQVLYRHKREQPWKLVYETTVLDQDLSPIQFGGGEQMFVYALGGKNTLGIYAFDPASKQLGQCFWQHEDYDADSVYFHAHSASPPEGVFCQGEQPQMYWLVPEWKVLQAAMDKIAPGRANKPLGESRDRSKRLFVSESDRTLAEYYVLDTDKKSFRKLGKSAAWIDPAQMAPMRPIVYQSRDGIRIRGYLTVPKGSSGRNLPLVMMPHGGPWTRDVWGYDGEVQFLANRGYAVLQVNFRGSTGYGHPFLRLGFRQWGRKMQDDITDGVEWAIGQGIADPRRVAIFGSSYGGYAALMGLIVTPELYRCGVCIAGVTDINGVLKTARRLEEFRAKPDLNRVTVDDYRRNRQELDAVSPLHNCDKIQAPVLLAYGKQDYLVPIEQGNGMARALKKNGKPYEMITERHEGHGFYWLSNRVELYKQVETFLQKNMK
jgi:pimeloyl-ACP methyl ester carboxylesterase